MKYKIDKAFTLVELLVVISIIAIISVVAYQNFWWVTSKAISARKIADITTIETSLEQYKADKKLYPPVWEYNSLSNMWWYTWAWVASKSNKITVTLNWQEISALNSWTWGWIVYWSWVIAWTTNSQIWAKWTISKNELWTFLTKDLYDPEIWDIKVWTKKMIDMWIWRYVYAISRKSYSWPSNQQWESYNIAITIKEEWENWWYITYITWNYDIKNSSNPDNYPETLIWTLSWSTNTWVLVNKSPLSGPSNTNNYWVPYAISDFAQ